MRQRRWPPGRTPSPRRAPTAGRAESAGSRRRWLLRGIHRTAQPRRDRRAQPCHGHELHTLRLPKREKPRTRITAADSARGGLSHGDLLAAEQREPADVDLGALGHQHIDVPERRDRVDDHLAGRHRRLPEIEIDVAEQRDRRLVRRGGQEPVRVMSPKTLTIQRRPLDRGDDGAGGWPWGSSSEEPTVSSSFILDPFSSTADERDRALRHSVHIAQPRPSHRSCRVPMPRAPRSRRRQRRRSRRRRVYPNASETAPSSANVSRAVPKSNILGHRFGFVALTTTWFDVTKANERSPSGPPPVPSDPLRTTATTAYTGELPQ